MTTVRTARIVCDDCGQTIYTHRWPVSLRRQAGWTRTPTGGDYCPIHAPNHPEATP